MTFDLGYAVASLIYFVFFTVALTTQVASRRYHPLAYWAVVVATTTVGTTASDFFDRTLGLATSNRRSPSSACSWPSYLPGAG